MKHNLEVVQDCSEVWCPKGRRGLLSVFKYISYNRVIFFLLLDWNVSYTSNSNLYPSWHQIGHSAWIYTIHAHISIHCPTRTSSCLSSFTVYLSIPSLVRLSCLLYPFQATTVATSSKCSPHFSLHLHVLNYPLYFQSASTLSKPFLILSTSLRSSWLQGRRVCSSFPSSFTFKRLVLAL